MADNLLVNGDFNSESDDALNTYDKTTRLTSPEGWELSGGTGIDLVNGQYTSSGFSSNPNDPDGNYIELDGAKSSSIAQSVPTAEGVVYDLSFDFGARDSKYDAMNTMEVWWEGQLVGTVEKEASDFGAEWETFNYQVTAGDPAELGDLAGRLEFRSAGTSDGKGELLDNVSLSYSPEQPEGVVLPGSEEEVTNMVVNGTYAGDDLVTYGGDDSITGGRGDDTIQADAGDDTVYGGDGGDTISGGDGADLIYGGVEPGGDEKASKTGDGDIDVIYGGGGDDRIYGEKSDDLIYGDEGNDLIYGGSGDDVIHAASDGSTKIQDDIIYGGSGNDTITLEGGNDLIFGGSGDDTFIVQNGGSGITDIKGGSGYTDTVTLQGSDGSQLNGSDFTITLSTGEQIDTQADSYINLSQDASGTVNFADGSSVNFDGIEKIEW